MSTVHSGISHVKFKTLILFLIALLFFGCFKASEDKLIEFSSDEGRFSLLMPGKPGKEIKNIPTDAGPIPMYMFMVDKPSIAYVVAYADYPQAAVEQSDPEEVLDGAKIGAMQNMGGTITSEEHITYGEDPGIELTFNVKAKKGKGHAVLILSGHRLYQVLALGSIDTYPDQTVIKFIDSFEIW